MGACQEGTAVPWRTSSRTASRRTGWSFRGFTLREERQKEQYQSLCNLRLCFCRIFCQPSNEERRKMIALVFFGALMALSSAQFQPQPSGRILESPIPSLCAQRTIHQRFNGKGYYFSWADPRTSGQEVDWLAGRNFCRQRCMDLVSLETSTENEFIKSLMVQSKVKYIWTSGRLCDFKGCDRPDLQPLHINGWFWTAELQKLAPTSDRSQNDWSESGGIGKPQPDNREAIQGGAPENCLAILNQFYNDGVNWHDVACHHKKPWVCEENESLLKYVRFNNPNIRV